MALFLKKGSRIQHLSSSDGAIVVLTHNGDLLALNEYQTRKIASKLSNIVKIEAIGGHLDPKALSKQSLLVDKGGQDLKVFILNHIGELLDTIHFLQGQLKRFLDCGCIFFFFCMPLLFH